MPSDWVFRRLLFTEPFFASSISLITICEIIIYDVSYEKILTWTARAGAFFQLPLKSREKKSAHYGRYVYMEPLIPYVGESSSADRSKTR